MAYFVDGVISTYVWEMGSRHGFGAFVLLLLGVRDACT